MFPQHDVEESVVDFQSVGIDLTGDEHGGDVGVPITEVAVDKVMVSVRWVASASILLDSMLTSSLECVHQRGPPPPLGP
jgi:hypothetical protein